jgi:hypothetical protein
MVKQCGIELLTRQSLRLCRFRQVSNQIARVSTFESGPLLQMLDSVQ